jgi:hypothetical protein
LKTGLFESVKKEPKDAPFCILNVFCVEKISMTILPLFLLLVRIQKGASLMWSQCDCLFIILTKLYVKAYVFPKKLALRFSSPGPTFAKARTYIYAF